MRTKESFGENIITGDVRNTGLPSDPGVEYRFDPPEMTRVREARLKVSTGHGIASEVRTAFNPVQTQK